MAKPTRLDYCQYLLSSPHNYTLTHFADHSDRFTHDMINRSLGGDRVSPREIWKNVKPHLTSTAKGVVLFDDTVLDKRYAKKMDLVRRQYSGNAKGVINGIGVVTCVYVNPVTDQFWLIDYRIYDPEGDGKTKLDHVKEMLSYQIEFILSYYYLLFFVVLPYCAEVSMWIDYPNQITESPEALLREEKRLKATPMADRVRFLRLLKSATYSTQTQVADLLGYDVRTLRRWWRCYRTEGLPGLLAQAKKRGAKERITASARAALLAAMKQGEIATMEEARQLLQTQFGVVYRSVSSLSKWCQRHGIKRKTGRPVHVKTDWDRQETLKKTSPRS